MNHAPATLMLLALTVFTPAFAQSYPAKPVRVLVGFPPGAGIDISVRLVTSKLTETLGRQFIVDNRAGAGGNIAVETATRATPDGYTLVGLTSGAVIAQSAYRKAPFDIGRELAPVAMMALAPLILTAHPSVPAKSLQELVALARAKPGQLSYATPGTGTAPHVTGELLKIELGIDLLHVPYKGNAPAVADVMGGNVLLSFSNILTALPHVKTGRLRPIAITSAKRSAIAPDVATIAESGLPGFESGTWYGIMAPTGTPRAIIDQLNREIVRTVELPDTREKLLAQGAEPLTGPPEHMERFVRGEIARWSKVVKAAGIRLE